MAGRALLQVKLTKLQLEKTHKTPLSLRAEGLLSCMAWRAIPSPLSILISQEADQVIWYSHIFQNFPQFIVIHTVKSFGIVNKAEIDVFLELSCFFDDLADVGNLISGSSAFSKTSLNLQKFTYC